MRWKKLSIETELTGMTRKRAAEIISELLKTPYVFDQQKNRYTVTDNRERQWLIEPSDDVRAEKMSGERIIGANYLYQVKMTSPFFYYSEAEVLLDAVEHLQLGGGLVNDTTNLTVVLDMSDLKNRERYQTNMANLFASRGHLIQKSIGNSFSEIADCSMLEQNGVIRFPLFKSTLHSGKLVANIQLTHTISQFAENNRTVSPKVNESTNERFLMRTWLVRAGMVGEEYKFARKLFTEKLSGNSAWTNQTESEVEKQEDSVEQGGNLIETVENIAEENRADVDNTEEMEMTM